MTDDARADEDTLSRAWAMVAAAGRFLVPSTLLASLFFYFGLRYTHDHYQQYGVDDAALGFSTTDYAVRSLNVIVEPTRVVGIAAVVAVAFHVAVVTGLHLADRSRPGSAGSSGTAAAGSSGSGLAERIARIVGGVLMVIGAVGMVATWSPGRFGLDPVEQAMGWLLSLLALLYGVYLVVARGGPGNAVSRLVTDAVGDGERRLVGAALLATAVLLLAHGAFEVTRAYARERAIQQALENEARPWSFPLVRIYSKVDLALDDALAVTEVVLPGNRGAYLYRYDELRLFLQQNQRLVLWPAARSPRSGMFVLRESDDVRVEYAPQLR